MQCRINTIYLVPCAQRSIIFLILLFSKLYTALITFGRHALISNQGLRLARLSIMHSIPLSCGTIVPELKVPILAQGSLFHELAFVSHEILYRCRFVNENLRYVP